MLSARSQQLKATVFVGLACLLVFWTYAPALNGLPIWDDNEALFNYPLIASPLSSYKRIWFSHQAPDFWPLHYSWFFQAYRWWGANTLPYHISNIVLHIGNAMLWACLLKMLRVSYAWVIALVFALHPANTEAVAWIVQFKTLASSLLCLTSWLLFLKFLRRSEQSTRSTSWMLYSSSLGLFAASLLTKSSVIFAPIAQCALTFLVTRDLKRTIKINIPFLLLAVASGYIAVTWYAPDNALPPGEHLDLGPFSERIARLGWNFWFYVRQALWPTTIAFIYPKVKLLPGEFVNYAPTIVAVMLPAFAFSLRHRFGLGPFAAILYYGLALAPALGFYGIYFMRFADVADHWQYMALIAPLALSVNAVSKIRVHEYLKVTAILVTTLTLALTTHTEARHFSDEESIWHQTLVHNPDSWLAHNNLGKVLMAQGNHAEAISHYKAALAVKPDFRDAMNNLGAVYIEQNNLSEAITILERTVAVWPQFAAARSNLGVALTRSGEFGKAAEHLRRATELAPEDASYHKNLGYTLHRLRQTDAAIESYQRAIALAPRVDFYSDLGQLLREARRPDDAIKALTSALALDPNHGLAMANLGFVYMTQARLDDALVWLRRAAAASPKLASVHLALATCLAEAGDLGAAAGELDLARKLDPQQPGTTEVARRIEELQTAKDN